MEFHILDEMQFLLAFLRRTLMKAAAASKNIHILCWKEKKLPQEHLNEIGIKQNVKISLRVWMFGCVCGFLFFICIIQINLYWFASISFMQLIVKQIQMHGMCVSAWIRNKNEKKKKVIKNAWLEMMNSYIHSSDFRHFRLKPFKCN